DSSRAHPQPASSHCSRRIRRRNPASRTGDPGVETAAVRRPRLSSKVCRNGTNLTSENGSLMSATLFDHPWYHVSEVAPGVVCIAEPSHVNSFLVLGDDRAALIDTGLAVDDISAVVAQI